MGTAPIAPAVCAVRRALPRAMVLALLLALPPRGEAVANGWEHAGIPYDALISALKFEDPATRMRAAHSLGHRGQKEAVPHLLAALAQLEPDHGVRSRIYLALGQLKAQAAAVALFDCLDRESREELRGDCAWALGGLGRGPGRDRVRDRLIAVLDRERHALVRRRAVEALGRHGDTAAVAALAAIAVGSDPSGRVRTMLQAEAIAALGATGHADAAAPLLVLLNRASGERDALPIVRALAGIGAPAAKKPLTALLGRARDPRLRTAVAVALASIGDRDTAATLTGLLGDPVPMVQLAAIRALETQGRKDRAPAVAAYARDLAKNLFARDGPARSRAATQVVVEASLLDAALGTLVALDAARGLDVLLTASRRRAAARATTADIVVANALYRVRRTAINGLGYTESGTAAAFLAGPDGLEDPDSRLRAAAVRSIAVLGRKNATAAVAGKLKDSRTEVRMAAARALGRLGDRRAVAPLIGALADRHAQVRRLAAESLGYLADPAAQAPLRQSAARDGSPIVRKAARFALTLLGRTRP